MTMSVNKYMHPKNIYKTPPNFRELALQFPEFKEFVKQDFAGKVSLDFKDVNALRALSRTLLLKDFGLDVYMPTNKLIPTIPLRLNYVLWIDDLLQVAERRQSIKGIDIGTGASCVYPLIAAKKFNWFMLATESDSESVEDATNNVTRNNLNDLIQVVQVGGDTILSEALTEAYVDYDFCMCNPPFFSSTQELHPFFKSRKSNRPHPRNAFCASVDEVVAKGGEVEFISKLVLESQKHETRVKIFTTMVGHKSSLPALKRLLRECDVTSFKQTEFCQGHTTRWGLAWTFLHIDLRKIPAIPKNTKSKAPLVHVVSCTPECDTLGGFKNKLLRIFTDLKFVFEENKPNKTMLVYTLTALTNTWSHQRRKKREQKQKSESQDIEMESSGSPTKSPEPDQMGSASNMLADLDISSQACSKRQREDDTSYFNCKKFKTASGERCSNNNYYLKCNLVLKKDSSKFSLELFSIDGNRENLHQVLQYIKNSLSIENRVSVASSTM